mmetsp:Transcript_2167/g.2085  ORF Transcript_2167/g.2085 Transcript_2167/m.2085 type:complete len:171 (-) Transcript_2167:19-531(-)
MGVYLVYLVFFLLDFFELLEYQFSFLFNAYALFDVLIIVLIFTFMLYKGAVINESFTLHACFLTRVKANLSFLKAALRFKEEVPQEHHSGHLFNMLQQLFREKADLTIDQQRDYIDDLIAQIDAILEQLAIDSVTRPFRLLGLKASYQLMNTIYTAILTLGVAMAQFQLS